MLVLAAVFATAVIAHNLDHNNYEVEKTASAMTWIGDLFRFLMWDIALIFIVPISWIATLFGSPQTGQNMYDKLVTGKLALSTLQD